MKKFIMIIPIVAMVSTVYAAVCKPQHFRPLPKSKMQALTVKANPSQLLNRNNGAEPKTLDSVLSSGLPAANVLIDLFDPLFRMGVHGESIAGVAKSWRIHKKSNGEYEYIFCLRKSYWSNGQPVKASNFVFAFRRAVNPASGASTGYLFFPIVNGQDIVNGKKKPNTLGVQAKADNILIITTQASLPYFKELLAMPAFSPQYPPAVKKWGTNWTKPEHMVTNGAFRLTKWVPNERIVLVKSGTYWDAKHVKLYQINYFPQSVASTAQRAYETGSYDFLNYASLPAQYLVYLNSHPTLKKQYYESPQLATYYYGINTWKKPVNNINLRKALTLAFQGKILTQKVLHGSYQPAYSFIPPGIANYVPKSQKPKVRFKYTEVSTCGASGLKNHKGYIWLQELNTKQAKVLAGCYLKAAGYTKSNAPNLNLYYNTSEQHKLIAVVVSNMWKQTLGTHVSLMNEEWKVFLTERRQVDKIHGKSPIMISRDGWVGDFNDPYTFLNLMISGSGNDDTGYHNVTFEKLVNKSTAMSNLKRRAHVLARAEQIMLDDFTIIPVFYYTSQFMVKPYIKGFPRDGIGILGYVPSRYLWVDVNKKS